MEIDSTQMFLIHKIKILYNFIFQDFVVIFYVTADILYQRKISNVPRYFWQEVMITKKTRSDHQMS